MVNLWAVQVLTLDYLIEGQIDGSDIMQRAIFSLADRNADSRTSVTLTGIQIHPTGSLPIPAANIPGWTLSIPLGVIGVIPRNEKGMAELLMHRKEKENIHAEMVIGHYFMRGILDVNPKYALQAAASHALTLREVEIDRITLDSQLKGWKVPAIAVTTHLLQGIWFR